MSFPVAVGNGMAIAAGCPRGARCAAQGKQEFTMPNTQRETARTATAARTEMLNMLKQDHKKVKKAFHDFERLDKQGQGDECQALVMQTCADLALHTALEEEIFYPAVRAAMREQGLIDEAEVEHACAKTLIADLQQLPPEDRAYAATFKVLGEYVQHHIKEEESEIFPQLTRAKLDWDGLQQQMAARRESLAAELLQGEQARPMPAHEPQGRTVTEGPDDE
jgi:hemerythrin-like domain-containing protein